MCVCVCVQREGWEEEEEELTNKWLYPRGDQLDYLMIDGDGSIAQQITIFREVIVRKT